MGYNLHITRKENWNDENSAEISLHEWRSYVQSDEEMDMASIATGMTNKGEVVDFESEGLAFWCNYSRHGIDGNKVWFVFQNGDVVVKNPDVEIRNKMIAVAASLQAKVHCRWLDVKKL